MKNLDLASLRKKLHENAEISGKESKTSEIIQSLLLQTNPAEIIMRLGGNGIAAIFTGKMEGPTILFRCELDALPIPEIMSLDHASKSEGVSHKCGHDGHMTIMIGFAQRLLEKPLNSGKVVLLFQPSEETGEGARLVIDDPNFKTEIPKPDFVFALHNLPGFPLGQIVIRENTFASASIGMIVDLKGSTSHASEPHLGRSPAMALAQIIQGLSAVPQFHTALHEACQVTIIHARLGEVAFGTSPGNGQVMATLRTYSSEVLETLKNVCQRFVENIARANDLDYKVHWREEFPATINHEEAVDLIKESAIERKLPIYQSPVPFPWSEDFGHFTRSYNGALFGIGAGEKQPPLHHPTYDFPDELIETGIGMFETIMHRTLKYKGKR